MLKTDSRKYRIVWKWYSGKDTRIRSKLTQKQTESQGKFHLTGQNTVQIIFISFCLSCLFQILSFQILFLKSLNTVYFQ